VAKEPLRRNLRTTRSKNACTLQRLLLIHICESRSRYVRMLLELFGTTIQRPRLWCQLSWITTVLIGRKGAAQLRDLFKNIQELRDAFIERLTTVFGVSSENALRGEEEDQ
jgi:hypothetical protein